MKCYHSGQDTQGFGICYSPSPWHQAGTKSNVFESIAGLRDIDPTSPVLLGWSTPAPTARASTHLCQPPETALAQVGLKELRRTGIV